jgi:hypothetical protein
VADTTATAVTVARGVGDVVMRSVSEHATITQSANGATRVRTRVVTAKTRLARWTHDHACTAGSRSGS